MPQWAATGQFTAVAYATTGGNFTALDAPHAPMPGNNFFAGGPRAELSTGMQTITLPKQLGTTPYSLCGWFGGFEAQNDSATLTATFLNASGASLKAVAVGGVKAADRKAKSGMLRRTFAGRIPAGATRVKLVLTMRRTDGNYNDGYADNLDLSIGMPGGPLPQ